MLTTTGRVRSVRLAGSKLMFLDIERDNQRLQVMVERKKLTEDDSEEKFKSLQKVARIGDWVCTLGDFFAFVHALTCHSRRRKPNSNILRSIDRPCREGPSDPCALSAPHPP